MTRERAPARAIRRLPTVVRTGLADAYRDALNGRRLAWASPAVALVGAFVAFYGLGLFVTYAGLGSRLPVVLLAIALGLAGLLVGLGLGWARPLRVQEDPPSTAGRTGSVGYLLIAAGLVAMAVYFIRIGDIPLFRPGLEQARVNASEEGGAALRVLAMFAIPGCWMAVAWAVHRRSLPWLLVAGALAIVVAGGWVLTGNRAPAFQTIGISLVVGLLTYGSFRLAPRGVGLVAVAALALVIAAGAFGAVRLASGSGAYGPPAPNAVAPPTDWIRLTQISIGGYLRVPVQNLLYTMEAVPERIGWRLGATYLLPVVTVLPGRQQTFDALLKEALDQRYAGGGTVPGLLGESYANFGPVGWFVVPAVVAFLLSRLYRRALIARSPVWWAVYGYAITHTASANLSGLSAASIFPWAAFSVLAIPILWPRFRTTVRALRGDRRADRPSPPAVPAPNLDHSDVV